ncbi:MAG TPA: hypothetical protein VGC13_26180 [Longimicrobium sp.]|jgi:hypothetical protein|uniref:DUF3108 domain-containing protein n=1 Tax=Longimicrobium sp. TaxID=2029185 RepID=UPI002EDA67DF
MRIHPLAAALLLACAGAPAAAAQLLRPGDAQVTAVLAEGAEGYDIHLGSEDDAPMGQMMLRTRLATVDGTPALVRTEETWMDALLVQVDSFILHRGTLAPLRLVRSTDREAVSMEFVGGGVRTVYHDRSGADTAETVPIAEPVFLGGTTDLLLGALPLAAGYTARLALYDPDEGLGTMDVEVEAAEDLVLDPGGRAVPTWRVRVTHAGAPATYWMDRESRTLVQFRSAETDILIVRTREGRGRARPTR